MARGGVVSVTHGGGPMPLLGDPSQAQLAQSMREKVPVALNLNTPDTPKAIVLVTAHWETPYPYISSSAQHDLYFDYGGFPEAAYELEYPAAGSPEVADLVDAAFKTAGFETRKDERRGWDHGVFVPMMLINPSASVPIVQVSVLASQDPEELWKMGQALKPLRDQNIAIVGSGSASFHNMRLLMQGLHGGAKDPASMALHERWNDGVDGMILEEQGEKRKESVLKWRELEGAYTAHPSRRAEHFSPLIVCAGAAGDGKAEAFTDPFAGYDMRTYYWN